jgi:glycosyltransferase involved in cell wall biosynthesis
MARFAFEPFLARTPMILDMVDVDSGKWADYAAASTMPRRWIYAREAATLGVFEAKATRRAFTTFVVNEREQKTLLDIVPDGNVMVLPVGIYRAKFAPPSPPTPDPTVVFCGVLDYYPNEDGVRWFAQRVWPTVRAAVPKARFLVVGAKPTRMVRDLGVRDPSIEVTGAVDAVQPYLWRSAVSVAPLRIARGIQTKVLEALAAGLPVVTTPAVLGGLPAAVHPGCDARDTEESFAHAVIDLLLKSPEDRRNRAALGVLDGLDWEECLRPVGSVLSAAQRSGTPA